MFVPVTQLRSHRKLRKVINPVYRYLKVSLFAPIARILTLHASQFARLHLVLV